jgi:hypothetical protein
MVYKVQQRKPVSLEQKMGDFTASEINQKLEDLDKYINKSKHVDGSDIMVEIGGIRIRQSMRARLGLLASRSDKDQILTPLKVFGAGDHVVYDQTLAAIKIVLMEAARLQGLSAEKQTQVQPVNLHDEAVKADIVNYQVFTTTRKGEEDLNNVSFWIYMPNGSLRVSFFEQLQRKKKNCHGKQPDNFHGKSDRSIYARHGIPIRVGVYMQVMNSDFLSDPIYSSDGIKASQEMLQSTACNLYILWFFHRTRSRSRKRGEKGAMHYLSWRDAISIPLNEDDA